MNAALLILRLVPGLLFMGHGLQKLVPARFSPGWLNATGPGPMAGFFEQMGLRPGFASVVLAGLGELAGGILVAAGLVTPLGTVLLAAVMTTAILVVHLKKGIWSTNGGFEYPLVMLTAAYAVSALGPGSLSVDAWAGISNWDGIHWAAGNADRAGAAVGIGVVAGLLTMAFGRMRIALDRRAPRPT
ncbi:MAG: DoxX family protein [Gaiellaceae bacterium]